MDFMKVSHDQNVTITDLDEWMAAFARWTLGVEFLFDEPSAKEAALEQRSAMCARAGVGVRS